MRRNFGVLTLSFQTVRRTRPTPRPQWVCLPRAFLRQPSLLYPPHDPSSDGGQCNPPERIWDDVTQEKCIRCIKTGAECGPNLTQFESDKTRRGKKRKAKQSLDRDSAKSTCRRTSILETLRPDSPFHDDSTRIETAAGKATFLAASDDDNNSPELTPLVEEHGSPVDTDSM